MKRIILLILFTFSLAFSQKQSGFEVINKSNSQIISTINPFVMTINASSVLILMRGTGRIKVNWGDGVFTIYSLQLSSSTNVSHTYSSSALRTVTIYNPSKIIFWYCTDNAAYAFDWAQTQKLSLIFFNCTGTNTISGTLTLPNSMTDFICSGSNTLTGTLSMPSGMTYFSCQGSNTLSGTLLLPAGTTYFYLTGNNTLSGYTTQSFSQSMNRLYLITILGSGFSSAEVDQLCIDLNGSAWTGTSKTLRLTGSKIAAPTSASSAARTALAGKGVSVTTN